MTGRLSERLRADTRGLHIQAERSPFMQALLRGRLQRAAYAELLHELLAIYQALEPALRRHAAHPALAPFDLAPLARASALQEDLDWLAPRRPGAHQQPTSERYVRRLHELDAHLPETLLAHAYVRYMGDLSGGQMLRGIVARGLGDLPAGRGLAFYDFGDAAVTAALKAGFRSALDQAPIADLDGLVAEAKLAFVWHRELFDELAAAFAIPA